MELRERLSEEDERTETKKGAKQERVELVNLEMPDVTLKEFFMDWLAMTKNNVEATTFTSYKYAVQGQIIPYFEERFTGMYLRQLSPKMIQDYYTYELNVRGGICQFGYSQAR